MTKRKDRQHLEIPDAAKEVRDGDRTTGLGVYHNLNRRKAGEEGIMMPLARSRFFIELKKRPQDMAIYREYVDYYNKNAEEHYTMMEIMDLAAMRMVLDKFLAFSLECETSEQAAKMQAVHTMVKNMYDMMLKYRKVASERERFETKQTPSELARKFVKVTEAEYTVIEDEESEGNDKKEDDDEDGDGVHEGTDGGVSGGDAGGGTPEDSERAGV